MSNWWAKRLAEQESVQARPQARPAMAPESRPAPRPIRAQAPEEMCPECGSANYMGSARSQKRCFDCGYPVQQSGSGMSATKAEGPVKKAVQIESGGYNPGQIIGRVE